MVAEMNDYDKPILAKIWHDILRGLREALAIVRQEGLNRIQFWFMALLIGILSGFAALLFKKGLIALESFVYQTADLKSLHTIVDVVPWYWVLLVPCFGGLCVGLIMYLATSDGRIHSIAEVIEGAALYEGRVKKRAGLASALSSFLALSTGASTGREGPVVHLAGVISSWFANRLHVDGVTGRELLGCAVAAAVSASFNAPIAGAIFALEVILRHFAIHAFAPIVIASVAGTVINRLEFGNVTEYTLAADGALKFYFELPAFVFLGMLCGVIAVLMMRTIFITDDFANWAQKRTKLPIYLRPACAGLMLGALAIYFPHIIGVGYDTTSNALTGNLLFHEVIVFAVLKVIAVAITVAGRMGGGIFSPALMVGSLTGLGFGYVATAIFPDISGTATLYALAGMGAVAAAVLGAPVSTTLIVFELTGDWQTGITVMIAISLSTAIASRFVDHSYFLTSLERRGVHLAAGPQAYLLATVNVFETSRLLSDSKAPSRADCDELVARGIFLQCEDTLEKAMPLYEKHKITFIPVLEVVDDKSAPKIHGALLQVDALKVFSQKLSQVAAEEHN